MNTLEYYNANAAAFSAGTQSVDFSPVQRRFLALLPPKAKILDFGCGAGRDTKTFLEQGCAVDAVDGSEALCRIASQYTGIQVRQLLFQNLDAVNEYDGIWACASVLHVPKAELPDVFRRMSRALKPGGILYASFKYGDFEGERGGRYFTDLTEASFENLVASFPELQTQQLWISEDIRADRSGQRWLNAMMKKTGGAV